MIGLFPPFYYYKHAAVDRLLPVCYAHVQINLRDKYLKVKELGQMISFFFIDIVTMFSTEAVPIYTPSPAMSESVYFPVVARTTVGYQVLFNFAHLIGEN